MDAVRRAEKRGDVSLDLQLVRDEMMSSVPLLNRIMMKLGWTTGLQNFIRRQAWRRRSARSCLISGVSGLSAYVIVSVFYGQFSLGLIAAAVGAADPIVGDMVPAQQETQAVRAAFSGSAGPAGARRPRRTRVYRWIGNGVKGIG